MNSTKNIPLICEAIGKRTVSYGCVITNSIVNPERTMAYKELGSMSLGTEVVLDVVRANVKKRPKLEQLLDELQAGDRIYIPDINDLIGATNKADVYYKKALDRDIEIYIVDFSKTLFNLHPLSIISPKLRYDDDTLQIDKEHLLEKFRLFAKNYAPARNGRRTVYSMTMIPALWQEVYFKYEAYQCDLKTALEELSPLGINNYYTFVKRAAEYEHYYGYTDDVLEYSIENKDFITTPKRIISKENGKPVLPYEYKCIKNHLEERGIDVISANAKNDYIKKIGVQYLFNINYPIYKRYENLDKMGAKRFSKDKNK